jgi:hypothetical protein
MNHATPAALVLLAAGIALAGCGSRSPAAGSPATTASASPTATAAMPTEAQLKSALLTAAEIGAPFKAEAPAGTSADSGKASGCEPLASQINDTSTAPGTISATAGFSAGDTGPFVMQALTSEPASTFEHSLKEATDALASCRHPTFTVYTLAAGKATRTLSSS